MFGIGSGELLIVFIIALIFIGPEKIPDMAKTLGRWTRKIKEAIDELKSHIDDN